MQEEVEFLDIFHDYVAIKPEMQADQTKGGIIIPDSYKERLNKGKVVGMGELLADKKIKLGMNIIHVQGAGIRIEQDNKEYYLMQYKDILCKS